MSDNTSAKVFFRKEFFDREYPTLEAYRRVWSYARKYRFRLAVGIICGIATAGTLVPFFQIVQPTLHHVETHDSEVVAEKPKAYTEEIPSEHRRLNTFEKQIERNSKLPSWYPKLEKLADKVGIKLQNEQGGMGGALLLIVCILIPLLALARLLLTYLNHYCLNWAGAHAVADIRQEMLGHVQRQSLQFFGRVDVGQILSRITMDPHQIQIILATILSEVAIAPFEILVAIGFIIWFAVTHHMIPTLLLIFVGFPMFVIPIHLIGQKVKRWARKTLERNSILSAKVHEVLTCIKVVKSYNTEALEDARYAAANKYMLKSTMRGLRAGLSVAPAVETVGILLICIFLVWCFMMNVKLSDVVPMLAPLLVIYKPVKQLSKLQVQIEVSMASLNRIFSLLDLNMELPMAANPVRKKTFDDVVSFKDVCFKYDTADRDAVSHATFDIPRGKMVAVVGTTGSGKSTMSGLLSRFFDPREGSVEMDGIDLRSIDIGDLRNLVGAVMQETLLFNDTIEENIRYGTPGATHEQVVEAAKMANAHEFIMSQSEGYSRIVGEKGFVLSGGERQRIAIARAILKNPPILILDEATSALDTITEKLVQDALDRLMNSRTILAIAHRLSTVRNADLILVMQDGRIVERGTHNELYAAGGVYRNLCDMQNQA